MRIGLLPLGRATFDVAFANETLGAMMAALEATGHDLVGPRELLFDGAAASAAVEALAAEQIDRLLVLQVTFTDASAIIAAVKGLGVPVAIWSAPEPRLGGRLGVNAFCGLNLDADALGLNGIAPAWAHVSPTEAGAVERLSHLLEIKPELTQLLITAPAARNAPGDAAAQALRGARIGRLGAPPDGFHTCRHDAARLDALAKVTVDELALDTLFERGRAAEASAVARLRQSVAATLDDIDAVDQPQLDRSLRLKLALDGLRDEGDYDAFAIRCWPETFTEYGGAVCGPVGIEGEARLPCACEADVHGALTQLLLQAAANAPVFLTDIVDADLADDTVVVWHCGQAPLSMASPATPPSATIHTNRKMPLLYQFALKPGPVTLARITAAQGRMALVVAFGEMLDRPMAFTGTSGVMRPAGGAGQFAERLIGGALEHHMALAYGDHRDTLAAAAATLVLPLVRL